MNKNLKVKEIYLPKKSDIKIIRKRTADVERELHSLEHIWKTPIKIKNINKWQKAIEEKIEYLIKTLSNVNYIVKNNINSIAEIKDVLRHNYENIKTIFDILKHLFEKDKKDKRTTYKIFKKKLPF